MIGSLIDDGGARIELNASLTKRLALFQGSADRAGTGLAGRLTLLLDATGSRMDGAAFKEALAELGHTQSSFAREHRLPVRTVQNWARNGPPEHMALMLSTMLRQRITPPGVIDFSSEDAGTSDAARALDVTLRSVLQRATRAGWPRDVAAAGAITWFARQIASKR